MSKEVKQRIGRNIRLLRESKGMTNEALAEELKISTSGLYSYESGRTEPNIEKVIAICKFFGIPTDAMLLGDFRNTDPASLLKIGKDRILFPISIDKEGKENVQLVSLKVRAGYTANYNDPEFISGLPSFQLPFLSKERTYRAFQIEGDSMNPIKHGSHIIAENVPNLRDIKDGNAYIIVTKDDGAVFKVVYNEAKKRKHLLLKSLNPSFKPYEVPLENVMEVWKFVNYFSSELPKPDFTRDEMFALANKVTESITEFRDELNTIKF